MEGQYHITVRNRRLHYELTVRRNITLIRGDSGTGKTLLVRMIQQASALGPSSGVSVVCQRPCGTLRESDWSLTLPNTHGHIIFLDTDYQFVRSKEFAAAVQASDNYFVIVSREDLPYLPYSEEEIYEIQTTGKEHELRRFRVVLQRAPLGSALSALNSLSVRSIFSTLESLHSAQHQYRLGPP